jgi:hypothetical protein
MKAPFKIILITLLITSFTNLANENPFKGTWKLIAGEYINEKNKVISYSSLGISSQKVVSEHHFSFVSMANGTFWAAGTGTYQFTQTEYAETPKMASYPLNGDGTFRFRYKIDGSLWHNSRWENDVRVEYEIWQKVK